MYDVNVGKLSAYTSFNTLTTICYFFPSPYVIQWCHVCTWFAWEEYQHCCYTIYSLIIRASIFVLSTGFLSAYYRKLDILKAICAHVWALRVHFHHTECIFLCLSKCRHDTFPCVHLRAHSELFMPILEHRKNFLMLISLNIWVRPGEHRE